MRRRHFEPAAAESCEFRFVVEGCRNFLHKQWPVRSAVTIRIQQFSYGDAQRAWKKAVGNFYTATEAWFRSMT